MLINLKAKVPEIVIGVLLTVAVFAIGMAFESERHLTNQPANAKQIQHPPDYVAFSWDWLTHDGSVFFTCVLAFIAAIQAYLFVRQLRIMHDGIKGARTAADATTAAAKAATRQAEIAERSFRDVERPHILIFGPGNLGVMRQSPVGNLKVAVGYSVGNYGRMPAIVKYVSVGIGFDRNPLTPAMVERTHPMIARPVMAINETLETIFAEISGENFMLDETTGQTIPKAGQDDLFLWVICQYRGPFTDHHETSACWRFDHVSRRFIGPHGGEQYNWYK
jgi:hypothetical protein